MLSGHNVAYLEKPAKTQVEINHLLWRLKENQAVFQREIKWASFSVLFLSGIRKVLLKNSPNTYISRRINQWGEIFCYHLDPEKELEKLEPGYLSSGYLATSDAFRCHVTSAPFFGNCCFVFLHLKILKNTDHLLHRHP